LKRSFRSRLFLSVIASVMVVLGIVIATAWVRVVGLETARLHARLCSEATRIARENISLREPQDIEGDIARKLRMGASAYVLVQQTAPHSQALYQSARWDQTVPQETVAWQQMPETALDPAAQDPQQTESAATPPRAAERCEVASFMHDYQVWQMARVAGRAFTGQVAANLEASQSEIKDAMWGVLGFVLPVSLLLSGIAAWVLSASLIRPVQRLRTAMRSMTPLDLRARLEVHGEDQEFKELITAYNTMLERLERSFHQASRFSGDAAHELKTPLTVLRGNIERLRRNAQDAQAHAQLSDLLDEVSRLSAITRKLLLLSQADAGKLELQSEEVDLTQLLQELVEDARMAGANKAVQSDIAAALKTVGDLLLLRQMFNNLISNALRYTPELGRIQLNASVVGDRVAVKVFNTCSPIPSATRARFFERFFRGEDAQAYTTDGSGLGLCLALEIAIAHQGNLVLLPSADTEVVLVVDLPAK